MRVLGIETSCDETGIAIFDTEKGLMSHIVYKNEPQLGLPSRSSNSGLMQTSCAVFC